MSSRAEQATIQSHIHQRRLTMTYDDQNQQNLTIDPAMILMGLGYAATLLVAIGWIASYTI
jgi:hypothetical protein